MHGCAYFGEHKTVDELAFWCEGSKLRKAGAAFLRSMASYADIRPPLYQP